MIDGNQLLLTPNQQEATFKPVFSHSHSFSIIINFRINQSSANSGREREVFQRDIAIVLNKVRV